MVRARVLLPIFCPPTRSDDQMSFKLEYLSAGLNQLDALQFLSIP